MPPRSKVIHRILHSGQDGGPGHLHPDIHDR